MTVDAARRIRRRASDAAPETETITNRQPALAIGELEQTVFECPSCSRPLALGARRCPGCGTRMLNGVSIGKASGFTAAGLAIGLLLGAGGGFVFGLTRAPAAAPAAGSIASPAPGASAEGGGAGASGTPASTVPGLTATSRPAATDPSGIPPLSRASLVQVAAINARLADARASLAAVLAGKPFDASAVAGSLRTISADAVFGQQLAHGVAQWPVSSPLGAQLDQFYGAIHGAAAGGLVASVQNAAAYRAAGGAMIKLLDGLVAVNDAVAATANAAGVQMPSAAPGSAAP